MNVEIARQMTEAKLEKDLTKLFQKIEGACKEGMSEIIVEYNELISLSHIDYMKTKLGYDIGRYFEKSQSYIRW